MVKMYIPIFHLTIKAAHTEGTVLLKDLKF